MRQPKYRAWDKDDCKMWKVVGFSEPIWGDCEEVHVTICDFDKSPLDKETDVRASFNYNLMQFTGLTDRNGVEIYEGDILKVEHPTSDVMSGIFAVKVHPESMNYVVDVYNLGAGAYKFGEVIGNIFENSDLLEV